MKKISNLNHRLYYEMLRIRKIEEKISNLYTEWEMRCPVHLSIGQEAISVGVSENLKKNDKVLSAHRSHANYLAKGGNLKKMLAELYGKETGCAMGKGGSMHLTDQNNGFVAAVPIVGSIIPIAAGLSWSNMQQRNNSIITVFLGEGSTEEGVFTETIDFAVLKSLPMLFVCENNFYSVNTSLSARQSSKRIIHKIVKSHGMISFHGNGNNVEEVNLLTKKSIDIIKNKNQPVFLEFYTYRWLEHCGPFWDENLGYRPEGELKKWIKKCPIKNLEKKLLTNNSKFKNLIKKYNNEIDLEIKQAFMFAKKSKFPNKKYLFEHIYK